MGSPILDEEAEMKDRVKVGFKRLRNSRDCSKAALVSAIISISSKKIIKWSLDTSQSR
jgi:hypothetical protein